MSFFCCMFSFQIEWVQDEQKNAEILDAAQIQVEWVQEEMTETNSEVDLTSRDGDVPHASLIVGATWYVEGRVHLGFFPQNLDYFLQTFSVICFFFMLIIFSKYMYT